MEMTIAGAASAVLEAYQPHIGLGREELPTPALILDLDVVRPNIALMAERMRGPAKLRPHAKTHKCAELARMQIEAGAIGITTATAWEAVALARAGIDDILIANEVAGAHKLALLAEAAQTATITLGVDSPEAADAYSSAAQNAGSTLRLLLDVDIGQNRCGVRSIDEALEVAAHVDRLAGVELIGVMGWEGHTVLMPDLDERAAAINLALDRLLETFDALKTAGFRMEVVSAGGTNTHYVTANREGVTEIQAGVYVFMDEGFGELGSGFSRGGLTVLTSVLSRQGETVVCDCGSKEIGVEPWGLPQPVRRDVRTRAVHEAHTLLDAQEGCDLRYGDVVELIPGHACTTVNLHEIYHVVEGNQVVDIWPILAHGPGLGTAV
jgi:D-threonine aldolase